eukprot:GHVU01179053.1.p3 GENE.GHVU01179053.1~~GHVU01179053.1.p3  ORF type:complete len:145 (-),score=32.87 GHVU01179053.1:272-706(-)
MHTRTHIHTSTRTYTDRHSCRRSIYIIIMRIWVSARREFLKGEEGGETEARGKEEEKGEKVGESTWGRMAAADPDDDRSDDRGVDDCDRQRPRQAAPMVEEEEEEEGDHLKPKRNAPPPPGSKLERPTSSKCSNTNLHSIQTHS